MLALMIILPLCGCGGSQQAQEGFTQWRESFSQAEEHGITAQVRFSQDEAVSEYLLAYTLTSQEETVEVLEPELIAKVKAHMEGETPRLSFDGVILEAGGSVEDISPMTALPLFMEFVLSGHLEGVWTEKKDGQELIVSELERDDGSKMTLWQSAADMTPLYAEIRGKSAVEAAIDIREIN